MKATTIHVSAVMSPGTMPLSIASLASGGGASAAAVANTSETNIRMTFVAVRGQQRRQAAQLAPAPGGRAPAADQVVATRAHSPATLSIGSRLRKTWSGSPLVAISR